MAKLKAKCFYKITQHHLYLTIIPESQCQKIPTKSMTKLTVFFENKNDQKRASIQNL